MVSVLVHLRTGRVQIAMGWQPRTPASAGTTACLPAAALQLRLRMIREELPAQQAAAVLALWPVAAAGDGGGDRLAGSSCRCVADGGPRKRPVFDSALHTSRVALFHSRQSFRRKFGRSRRDACSSTAS